MKTNRLLFALSVSAFQYFSVSGFGQGSLTPPGAPAPTMKTLAQVEPRIEINSTNTPGDAVSLFKISQPGSYYLSGNITGVASKYGVRITANDVTLDLKGFELVGVASSLDGVSASGASVAIRNGTARNWGGVGVNGESSTNSQFQDLRVSSNGNGGIYASDGSIVGNCNVTANGGTAGIAVASGGKVSGCTATSNGTDGINVGFGCTVNVCTTRANGRYGIFTAQGSMVSGCTATSNTSRGIFTSGDGTVSDCTANLNGGDGINAGSASTVIGSTGSDNHMNGIVSDNGSAISGCTASYNYIDGVKVNAGCRVTDNTCVGNGVTGTGNGIETTSSNNRIDSNQATGNTGYGLKSSGPIADFIIRNVCFGNAGTVSATATADYSPKSGAYFGPLSLPGNATSPWANF